MFANWEQEYYQIEQNMFIFKTDFLSDIKLPFLLMIIRKFKYHVIINKYCKAQTEPLKNFLSTRKFYYFALTKQVASQLVLKKINFRTVYLKLKGHSNNQILEKYL